MTPPRRHVIRPPNTAPAATPSVCLSKLRSQLVREQQSLTNWTTKFKLAFHSFEKHQRQIVRLQRRICELEKT